MTALGAAAALTGLIATPHTGLAGETVRTKDGKEAKKEEPKSRFTLSGWVDAG